MGKVQGGMKCVKYLLFVFNLIFWAKRLHPLSSISYELILAYTVGATFTGQAAELLGLFVLTVGLWLRFDPNTVQLLTGDNAPETFFLAVYILIGAGTLMMLVGFFGCFGAVRESQCLLASFFACLLIIFGAEVTVGVFGFLHKEQVVEEVQKFYSSSIDDNVNGTAIVSTYHNVLKCCSSSLTNPTTVCPDDNEESKDCLTAITDFFNEKLYIIGYVGIGIAAVMVIGMIFSMVLCCAIRTSREVI